MSTSATRGGTVIIALNAIGATLEGEISHDLNSIDGTFTQGGVPLPLIMKRDSATRY